MHRNNILIIVVFTLLLLVEEDLGSRTSNPTESKSCKVTADVVAVFEIPAGRSGVGIEIGQFFRRLRATLKPSHSCIRLSYIFAWQNVNTFDCSHTRGPRCARSADNWLTSLRFKFPKTKEFDKNNLVTAIDSAKRLLFSDEKPGARKRVKKVCLLILNSTPKKNVIPTEDAVKDLHDLGVVVIAVGVKDGRKENLNEAVMYPRYAVNASSIRSLYSTQIITKLETLIVRPYKESVSAIRRQGISTNEINQDDLKESCTYIVDIGFLVDSSGSLRKQYEKEKKFVQRIATKFNISEAGSHGGVIIFSAENYVKTVIQFTDYTNLKNFIGAVDSIPYYGYLTRIDLALEMAHRQLFTVKEGARPNVKKVAFLITDGMQNPDYKNGVDLDPASHAVPLHDRGINIFAVGVGEKINFTELALITRSKDRVYTVKNFEELISDKFVKSVSKHLCEATGKAGILDQEEDLFSVLDDNQKRRRQTKIPPLLPAKPSTPRPSIKKIPTPKKTIPVPPIPTTSRPLPKTQRPLRKTQRPLPKTQRPPPKTQRPLPKTQRPLPKTQRPLPKTQRPLPKTQRPLPKTQRPLPKTQRPQPKTQRPQPQPRTPKPLPKTQRPLPKIPRPQPEPPKQLPKTPKPLPEPVPKQGPCKQPCSSCGSCSGGCCNEKPDVFINVFSGSNSKNYLSQGMKVTQSGNSRANSDVNFPESNDSGGTRGGTGGRIVKQNTKELSSNAISSLIKDCLPYQKKMNEGIQELLRRSLKAQTANPNVFNQINKNRRK